MLVFYLILNFECKVILFSEYQELQIKQLRNYVDSLDDIMQCVIKIQLNVITNVIKLR